MNTSGVTPLDLRVVVMPDPVETTTPGGIIIPEASADRQKYAMTKGTLIAAGENAWEEAASRSQNFTRPQPGDRVMIAKYGGTEFDGSDGTRYLIMNDEDVIARLEE